MHRQILRNWWWAPIALLCGGALSYGAHLHLLRVAEQTSAATFEGLARDQVRLVQQAFERGIDAAATVVDLHQLHPQVSRDSFERFGATMLSRYPIFSSVGWSEWVPAAEREAIVTQLQGAGYPLQDVMTRPALDAEYEPAPHTFPHHLVLTRIAPAELEASVGFDVASPQDRRQAVLLARDSGTPAIVGPLRLGGRPAAEAGYLIIVPAYRSPLSPSPALSAALDDDSIEVRRAAFAGAASLGLLLQPMLRQVLRPEGGANVRLLIYDQIDGDARLLFDSAASAQNAVAIDALARDPLALTESFTIGGRTWHTLAVPTTAFRGPARRNSPPHIVLALGIVATMLALTAIALALRHQRSIRRHLAEREAAALALARTNDALLAANEDMEQFVSAVSHDLKNPLGAVELAADLLERALARGDMSRATQAASTFRSSTQAMRRIINNLLEHSRAGWAPMAVEAVDLDALVARILDEHADALRDGDVDVEVAPLPAVHGDAGRLAAAVDNLIANALKHGRVPGQRTRIRISGTDMPGETRIVVSDNGRGVATEHREMVFKLFKRLAADSDGTGLGLAIVDRVARAHGGRAWVEEADGGGAAFVIVLPRHGQRDLATVDGAAPTAPAVHG
jgi:signal transduction histidine kinase